MKMMTQEEKEEKARRIAGTLSDVPFEKIDEIFNLVRIFHLQADQE